MILVEKVCDGVSVHCMFLFDHKLRVLRRLIDLLIGIRWTSKDLS